MARKLFLGSSSNTEDLIIDDSNDKIYSEDNKIIYGITRNPQCKSLFIVSLINKLGELGVYDQILKRISDNENWASIELVSLWVTILG